MIKSKRRERQDCGTQQYSLEKSITFNVHRIANSFAQSMLSDLRPESVNVARWRVLSILRSLGQSTIGEITAVTGYQQPIVSRTITEMEGEGTVTRRKSVDDQRVFDLVLTPVGEALFDRLFPLISKRRKKALKGLSAEDQKRLMGYLKTIQRNLGIATQV